MFELGDVTRDLVYKDSRVFEEGDPGNAVFIVETGSVGIFKLVEGEDVMLATLRDGEMFGEMAIIDGGPRMAGAVALEDTVIVKIPSRLLDAKLEQYDPFLRALLEILVGNLRQVHRTYMRRPRSVHDHLNTAVFHVRRCRQYVETLYQSDIEVESWRTLNRVEEAIVELRKAFEPFKDKRHNVLSDADL